MSREALGAIGADHGPVCRRQAIESSGEWVELGARIGFLVPATGYLTVAAAKRTFVAVLLLALGTV